MQRHHRIRHRMVWLILGPLAVAAFLYALLNRPTMPVMETVPEAMQGELEGASRNP